MSIHHCKKKMTAHARIRMTERLGEIPENADGFLKNARKKGLTYEAFPESGELRWKLEKAEIRYGRPAYVYKGCVFVFFSTSDRLVTMYRLSGRLLEEVEAVGSEEKRRIR